MVGGFFLGGWGYVGKGFKIYPCTIAVEFLYLYCNCIINVKGLRCQVTWATEFCMFGAVY
jgi:hypothetical protein